MESMYARDVYGQTLVELGKSNSNLVVMDADLSGSTRTALFAKEFPDRFFNVGIAEQNLMAIAAGLASTNKVVFVSTFAMFATTRPLDQVRNAICYNQFNVKIVATHGGITVGEDGASHQALEDINNMRAIPHMQVIVPADGPETKEAVIAAFQTPGPFYIRLGRAKIPSLVNRPQFKLAKGYILEQGNDLAIIACGSLVQEALAANTILRQKGLSATIVNMPTIKPLDQQLIIELAVKHKKILVCEEHQVIGGLFSAVCETVCRQYPIPVWAVAVENRFGQSGSPNDLMEFYGLSANAIAQKAQNFISQPH